MCLSLKTKMIKVVKKIELTILENKTNKELLISSSGRVIPIIHYFVWVYGVVSLMFATLFIVSLAFVPNQSEANMINNVIDFASGMVVFALIVVIAILIWEYRAFKRFNQIEG